MILLSVSIASLPSNALRPVTASNRMQPKEKMSERWSIWFVLPCACSGYMSPEQAQGKTNQIDHRSDIFSFGCILFEAVTGRRAFEGKDAIDTLNKIIREPAPSIGEWRPDAPSDLQRIARRCLAKDPEDRYQTIKDVAIELRELRREIEGAAKVELSISPETTADQHVSQ